MEEDASLLTMYMKQQSQTGYFENYPVCIVIYNPETNNIESSLPTLSRFLSEKKNRKYMAYYSDFLNKWKQHQFHFRNYSQAFVFEKIKEVIDTFLTMNPSYITFELTKDCSVFFQSMVNGFNIYLELYFTNDLKDGVEAITNIYQDGRSIFAYGGSIEVVFSKIISKISTTSLEVRHTQTYYAISEPAFATTKF